MNFAELLLHIQDKNQDILAHHTFEILTADTRYVSIGGDWSADTKTEGTLQSRMTRGGKAFFWGPKIETVEETPIIKAIEKKVEVIVDVPCNIIGVPRCCNRSTLGCNLKH